MNKRMKYIIGIVVVAILLVAGSATAKSLPLFQVMATSEGFNATPDIGASVKVSLNPETGESVYCIVDMFGKVVWCGCPCTEGLCEIVPDVADLTSTNTPLPPTATPVPPTATPQPTSTNTEKLWIWIHHESQGKGDPNWDKCMPIAAWNGHSGHTGDVKGGACTP